MATDWAETGRRVASIRAAERLSQYDFAAKLGISVRALGDLERGRVVRPSGALIDIVRGVLAGPLPEEGESRTDDVVFRTSIPTRSEITEAQRALVIIAKNGSPQLWASLAGLLEQLAVIFRTQEKEERRNPHNQRPDFIQEVIRVSPGQA